ncbi:MAG: Gfo/Idh/MocA family oxidoreductase [Planctomycetales bacterium]|nr:Gfo/Idh/MocA family oxidoreductase [Planctomycetales bacterium]
MMIRQIGRRQMLKTSALAGAGFWLGTQTKAADSPNEKLNVACIGIGGRGAANVSGVESQNIVALCDVDDSRAGKAYERHSKAKKYIDFRKMLDKMDKQIDAVVVSTPDHTHFHPSMMAMQMGKHLYCEKPMAHTVWEAREMTKMAAKMKVATQLGVQRHTLTNMHRSVELIKSGAIGKVSEVHSWIGGDRGMPTMPTDKPAIPSGLDWDLWLGPAKERPYHTAYCPYGWRFWWDFGTGETGNWGCHILDIPYWALGLKYPTRVEGTGPEVDPERTPKAMTTSFEFAEQDVKLHWYHAKNGPLILAERGLPERGMNTLFIGTDGMLLTGFSKYKLYPEDKFADFKPPAQTIEGSPGFYKEWFTACKGGTPATCNFDYSGPLSETVLLGNVAYRAGGAFDWDAKNLATSGNERASQFIRSEFRKGWQL